MPRQYSLSLREAGPLRSRTSKACRFGIAFWDLLPLLESSQVFLLQPATTRPCQPRLELRLDSLETLPVQTRMWIAVLPTRFTVTRSLPYRVSPACSMPRTSEVAQVLCCKRARNNEGRISRNATTVDRNPSTDCGPGHAVGCPRN